jgi:hypothetical protein
MPFIRRRCRLTAESPGTWCDTAGAVIECPAIFGALKKFLSSMPMGAVDKKKKIGYEVKNAFT